MPVNGSTTEQVVEVQGQRVRILDEDYLSVCWDENLGPLPFADALPLNLNDLSSVVCSTVAYIYIYKLRWVMVIPPVLCHFLISFE